LKSLLKGGKNAFLLFHSFRSYSLTLHSVLDKKALILLSLVLLHTLWLFANTILVSWSFWFDPLRKKKKVNDGDAESSHLFHCLLVVFGATGFTGELTCEYLLELKDKVSRSYQGLDNRR
jgi:hypothetical protein